MKRFTKVLAAIMLMTAAFIAAGCTKTDDPNNGGNNDGGNGGNGGGNQNNHEYVDLGLPSGTLWATCNVGADTPEGYGDYFAWGETTPKTVYTWESYIYAEGTSDDDPGLTKYCSYSDDGYNGFIDNLTTLLPEDDAATANWGADWRTPTDEQWGELRGNTTYTWITLNGVNGRLFIAANGNSLFLPAAGNRRGSELYNDGRIGDYWSSDTFTTIAGGIRFSSNFTDDEGNPRFMGQSVRAVRAVREN